MKPTRAVESPHTGSRTVRGVEALGRSVITSTTPSERDTGWGTGRDGDGDGGGGAIRKGVVGENDISVCIFTSNILQPKIYRIRIEYNKINTHQIISKSEDQ